MFNLIYANVFSNTNRESNESCKCAALVPGVIEPRFQYIHVLHCLMEKMVYSDEEIKKGLTFSTIERKNEKKENIGKDGKRKILLSKRQKHENTDDDE